MIKAEWKKIFNKPMLAVIIIVLMIIPTLYNVIFLKSMWDPYGSLDKLPVAIVNQDKSFEYRGESIDVGKQFINELKKNKDLDFQFVNKKTAKQGLNEGKYYAVVTIPDNFSKEATSVFENNPRPMQLTYETSQGHNYTASKMSKSAMTQMESKLTNQMSEMYFKTLLSIISQSTDGINQFESGASRLVNGASELSKGHELFGMHLGELNNGTKQLNQGVHQLSNGVITYTQGASQIADGQFEFNSHLGELGRGASQLNIGAEQLVSGITAYANGVEQLSLGQNQLYDGINQFSSKIPILVSGLNELSKGSQTFDSKLNEYARGVDRLSIGLVDFNMNFSKLTNQWPILNQGLFSLADGASQLNQGIDRYTRSVNQLTIGTTKLNSGIGQLNHEVSSLPKSADQLNSGLGQIIKELNQNEMSTEQRNQLINYTNEVSNYIDSIQSWLNQYEQHSATTPNDLKENIQMLFGQLTQLNQTLQSAQTSLSQYQSNIVYANEMDKQNAFNGVVQSLNSSGLELTSEQVGLIQQAIYQPNQVDQAVNNMPIMNDLLPAIKNAQHGVNRLMEQIQSLTQTSSGQIDQLRLATQQLIDIKPGATAGLNQTINSVYNLQVQLTPALKELQRGTQELAIKAPVLVEKMEQIESGSQQIFNGMSQLNDQSSKLTTGSDQINQGLNQTKNKLPELTDGLNQLQSGSNQLQAGSSTLSENTSLLLQGADQIASGVSQISNQGPIIKKGMSELQRGSSQLVSGSKELRSNSPILVKGTNQLFEGTNQLNQGIPQLINGSRQLLDGVNQLRMNSPRLVSGANQLEKGTSQLTNAVPQLLDGSNKLTEGTQTLQKGSNLLHDKLVEASEELELVPSESGANPMSQPIALKHIDTDHVENNGMAMAPYMLSVALFIGALTTNMLYNSKTSSKNNPTAWKWWLSKMSVLMLIALGQASIVYFALTRFNDFTPLLQGKTILFLILEAMTYMSIVTVFDLYFGKIGDFLMLVFLIVQLAGSAGTYPIELSNGFYQTIHPLLPMTHAIRALRQTISIGGSIQTETIIFISLFVIAQTLLVGYYNYSSKKQLILENAPTK